MGPERQRGQEGASEWIRHKTPELGQQHWGWRKGKREEGDLGN